MTIRIGKLLLNSGAEIAPSSGLTAIVGPNNAGKSLLLREILQRLTTHEQNQIVQLSLHSVEVTLDDPGDVEAWLTRNYDPRPPGVHPEGVFDEVTFVGPQGHNVLVPSRIASIIARGGSSRGELGPTGQLICLHLGAESRLAMTGNSVSFNPINSRPSNAVQILYLRPDLEDEIRKVVKRAFSTDFTINRSAGSEIMLHLGRPTVDPGPPPGLDEYRRQAAALPGLNEQGDGVRAFIGILFSIMTTRYPVVLIDEPEAFLHPPQAYMLGRILAEQQKVGSQTIVATHSADFLAGVTSVSAASESTSIVRLTRNEGQTAIAQVDAAIVSEIFSDSLIRYFNVFGGLFAEGTVICESDSDCTYYRAVLESKIADESDELELGERIHFTHCSGKSRIPKAVAALRGAGVQTVSIVDIDILRDDKDYYALVAAHGGDAPTVDGLRNDVVSAVSSQSGQLNRAVVKSQLATLLDGKSTSDLSASDASKLRSVLSAKSGWREFKRAGRALLSGQSVASFDKLEAYLRSIGIFIVSVGELERFHPEVSADNKAAWLQDVLETEKYKNSPASEEFMRSVLKYLEVKLAHGSEASLAAQE